MSHSQTGPLLAEVLDAQHTQREALNYPNITGLAVAVASAARSHRCDLLWPVDLGAHKLLGAVEVLTCGGIETRSFDTDVTGRSVLLVATIAVSALEMAREKSAAAGAGARRIHGAALDPRCRCGGLDSFSALTADAGSVAYTA